jgi:cytosine deaminase
VKLNVTPIRSRGDGTASDVRRRNAGRQPLSVPRDAVLDTALSPCAMCGAAILFYGIPSRVVGEKRAFPGKVAVAKSSGVEMEVVQEPACVDRMGEFIARNPRLRNEDIGVA